MYSSKIPPAGYCIAGSLSRGCLHRQRSPGQRALLEKDPPGQRPLWTDTPWTETPQRRDPAGQRVPLDSDPAPWLRPRSLTETPLPDRHPPDRDPPTGNRITDRCKTLPSLNFVCGRSKCNFLSSYEHFDSGAEVRCQPIIFVRMKIEKDRKLIFKYLCH